MKVLHLLDTVNRGGAETLILDVCRNAADFGIDLTFATTQGGELEADFRASGAAFYRLNRRLPIDFGAILQLRKIIKEREIEIVHAHQAVDGLQLYLATAGLPVKRVLTFHGFVADAKNRRTLRFLIPRMNANIYVSRSLQNWLEQTDKLDVGRNSHVIYNGTDAKRLEPTGKNLRKELGLSEGVLLLGMIGNFYRDPRKDQLTLCRALPSVFAEIGNAHCVFAGKTEVGAEEKFRECADFCRENGIGEKVHFLGVRDDIPDGLAALDLFVFSSLQEGLPIALTEAMLAGVPLIVSDIEPLLEASGDGKYTEVFPVKNAEILGEKIINLLKDENRREDLAVRALKFAEETFSIEAHLQNLKELYNSF
ncbi:MAG: glycosyltransferase family 4 protein [Pyrinomonadaceae bacterium]|nr:glycosyltransferase family 4 protein [Pyrinomonadaceae bacterium]